MPMLEFACFTASCDERGRVRENYYSKYPEERPPCPACQQPMRQMISRFSMPFNGLLSRHDDSKKERTTNYNVDGHWAWKTRSSRLADGSPEPVFIRNRQDQLKFIKEEGLVDPVDLPREAEASADGKKLSGLVGSWD